MEIRQALLWSGLLLGSQATDTLTTAIDRARGAIEAMPVSARLLEVGGVALFWGFKVLIVASAAAALMAAAGMRPMDIIVSATKNASAVMGRQNEAGTLEKGKSADLVILDADPIADIQNTRKIFKVMKAGEFLN